MGVRTALGTEPCWLLNPGGNCGGNPPGFAGVSTDAVRGSVESKFKNWTFVLHGSVMMLDAPGVCVGVGLGFGVGLGVGVGLGEPDGIGLGIGGGEICA